MKITSTRDDVTGAEISDGSAQEVKITVGDVTGVLDLGAESLAALAALASGEGSGKLTALLSPRSAPVKRSGKSGGSRDGKPDPFTGATPDVMRAWAASQGITVNARGRVPADVLTKYREAHGKPGTAPASAPASTPASADAASTPASAGAASGKTARK